MEARWRKCEWDQAVRRKRELGWNCYQTSVHAVRISQLDRNNVE
jgi:hypothetical protein